MAKVLLLNNTENYHSGCRAVIDFYRRQFRNHDLILSSPVTNFDEFDVVIVNGEGTMHHNAESAAQLLDQLVSAKKAGCRTMLTNTVWQDNDTLLDRLVSIDYISVREVKSQQELQCKLDRAVELCIDYSYFSYVPSRRTRHYKLTAGNRMNYPNTKPKRPKITGIGEDSRADIFCQTWTDLIDTLTQSQLFVTGRHHELYAACVARCPVVVLEGNSHKNSGVMQTAGVQIPCLDMNAGQEQICRALDQSKDLASEYQKLFDFLGTFPEPDLVDAAGLG